MARTNCRDLRDILDLVLFALGQSILKESSFCISCKTNNLQPFTTALKDV